MATEYTFDDLLIEILGGGRSPIDARGTPQFTDAIAGRYGAIPKPAPAAPAATPGVVQHPRFGAIDSRAAGVLQQNPAGGRTVLQRITGTLFPTQEEQVPPPPPIFGARG